MTKTRLNITRLDTQSCDQANLGVGMTSRDIFINSVEKFYFRVPAAATREYPASLKLSNRLYLQT
jgi:hypothetical protein